MTSERRVSTSRAKRSVLPWKLIIAPTHEGECPPPSADIYLGAPDTRPQPPTDHQHISNDTGIPTPAVSAVAWDEAGGYSGASDMGKPPEIRVARTIGMLTGETGGLSANPRSPARPPRSRPSSTASSHRPRRRDHVPRRDRRARPARTDGAEMERCAGRYETDSERDARVGSGDPPGSP